MSKESKRVLDAVKFLRQEGYEPVFVALYGSQNYGMADETSDIDLKAAVVPKFDDVVRGLPMVSKDLEFEDGLIDVKDIRLLVNSWKKQNPNFMEILFTKWQWVNSLYPSMNWFILNREAIAHANEAQAINAMRGMMNQKYSHLFHDTPAQHDVIEKYGYSGKQLSHLCRLLEFMSKYKAMDYEKLLVPDSPEDYVAIKRHDPVLPVEEVKELAESWMQQGDRIADDLLKKADPPNDHLMYWMDEVKFKIVSDALRKEIMLK